MRSFRISEEQAQQRVPQAATVQRRLATHTWPVTVHLDWTESVGQIADRRSFRKLMIFYTPTGPLSGVTDIAIAVWILADEREHYLTLGGLDPFPRAASRTLS